MPTSAFQSGRAAHRIKLQAKSVTRNAIGEEIVTWTDVVTETADHCLWAEAWPLKGREFFAAAETQYAADVRFRLRYRSGVVREQRILWDGEPYDITQVFGQVWPNALPQIGAVWVTFDAGYGAAAAVPEGLKSWIKLRVGSLYAHREEVALLTRGSIAPLPFIDGLLDPYRVVLA